MLQVRRHQWFAKVCAARSCSLHMLACSCLPAHACLPCVMSACVMSACVMSACVMRRSHWTNRQTVVVEWTLTHSTEGSSDNIAAAVTPRPGAMTGGIPRPAASPPSQKCLVLWTQVPHPHLSLACTAAAMTLLLLLLLQDA